MKKYFKKISAIILTFSLLSGSINMDISANNTSSINSVGDYVWGEDEVTYATWRGIITGNNTVELDYYHHPNSTEYVLPSEIDGYKVTSIADNLFKDNRTITSIVIPDSVITIGDFAFYNCSNLKAVTIGNSVETIGTYAFYGCQILTSAVIGNSVKTIGEYAFNYCGALTSVTIPDSVTKIGFGAFMGCHEMTSVKIGNSVETIGDNAFWGCLELASVTIPDSVTTIGFLAFNSTKISTLVIPSSVTSVGFGALNSGSLTTLYFMGDALTFENDFLGPSSSNCRIYYDPSKSGWADVISYYKINYPSYNFVPMDSTDPDVTNTSQIPIIEYYMPGADLDFTYNRADDYFATPGYFHIYTTDGGELTYQWYANGAPVDLEIYESENVNFVFMGASVAMDKLGVTEYYFTVTNTISGKLPATSTSDIITITVVDGETAQHPVIEFPSNTEPYYYEQNSTATPIIVNASVTDGGTLTYQWHGNDGEIDGATEKSYTPSTSQVGVYVYNCAVTNTKDNLTSATSYTALPQVVVLESLKAGLPTIGMTNLDVGTLTYQQYDVSDGLYIHAWASDGGILTYQWYIDGVLVSDEGNYGGSHSNLDINTSEIGTKEYYCVITNTPYESYLKPSTLKTDSVVVTVVDHDKQGAVPEIEDYYEYFETTYVQNSGIGLLHLSATVTDGGTLTYQWYADNVAIDGATISNYMPSSAEVGEITYYCLVTNTPKETYKEPATARSKSITITITEPVKPPVAIPTFTINNLSNATYDQNAQATALSITADVWDGNLSYQWYLNDIAIDGAITGDYIPSTSQAGTQKYYCIVTNTPNSSDFSASTAKTIDVLITVNEVQTESDKAEVPTIGSTNFSSVTRSYTQNQTNPEPLTVNVTVTDGGTLTYQWYADGVAINNATTSSYTPSTSKVGTTTYYCIITNTPNSQVNSIANTITVTASTIQTESVSITIYENAPTTDYDVVAPTITENYASQVSYNLNDTASPLSIEVNASRIESDTLKYTWYKSSNDYSTGDAIESGSLNEYSITTISVTPATNQVGSAYYYCVVTNTYNGESKSITSDKIRVIVNDTYSPSYPTYPDYNNNQIDSDGNLYLSSYSNAYVDRTNLENYLNRGGNNLNISGAYIQSINLPQTYNNTSPYTVTINDTGTGLSYTWKINNGRNVSSNLDLSVSTKTSVSNVNQSYTNLNYDSSYSQVIDFSHNGSLNADGSTMLLTIPTTVSDGTVWLYKLSNGNILTSQEVQGSVFNGVLYVSMQSCSDWVISKIKLIDVTSNENTLLYNIKTDARFVIPTFQNVALGTYINLSTINTDFFTGYRFEGWYYDTAFTLPVTGSDLTNLHVTSTIVNNGIYPKLTYYNTHVPSETFPVPTTSGFGLKPLF